VKPCTLCHDLQQYDAWSRTLAVDDAKVFRFGSFYLASGRRQLSRGGTSITIGARAFDLLVALVRRQGQLASKDELLAEVWAGTVVDENNLAAQISALRKVLAADPEIVGGLQTVPGRGYRFVASVELLEVAAIAIQRALSSPGDSRETLAIVVLPFVSLSSDADQAYFALGLSQIVSTDLSRIAGLLAISPSTAATFESKTADIRQVSRDLGVTYVLTGSVQRGERDVRISAQLVDGRSGAQIWSERFDGDTTDLLALQDRITGQIANALGREIFAAAARDGEARKIDPRAFDLLMRGIAADNRPQSLDGLREQERLFARAAELDPSNGDTQARLARAVLLQATQAHAPAHQKDDILARGVDAAEKAVALDPGNARAHLAMGLVHVLRGDYERSVIANELAILLDRNLALAHNNLGNSLVHLGKGEEAKTPAQMALRLDPRGPQIGSFWTVLGFAHLLLGEIEHAAACFSRGREANPKLARARLGVAIALALQGDLPAARLAGDDLMRLAPDYRLSRTIDGCHPNSPPRYRQFYEQVLLPGANVAGIPH
jgi:TolB-like protein/Flp pilus assembly protein TadD